MVDFLIFANSLSHFGNLGFGHVKHAIHHEVVNGESYKVNKGRIHDGIFLSCHDKVKDVVTTMSRFSYMLCHFNLGKNGRKSFNIRFFRYITMHVEVQEESIFL